MKANVYSLDELLHGYQMIKFYQHGNIRLEPLIRLWHMNRQGGSLK